MQRHRTILLTICFLFVFFICALHVCAEERSAVKTISIDTEPFYSFTDVYEYMWYDKLFRGIINVATAPIEIVKEVHLRTIKYEPFSAMVYGAYYGVVATVKRMSVGVVEMLTFPLCYPDAYMDPLYYPVYAWEDWDVSTV